MCGISGYIDLNKGVDKKILEEMTAIISHRGPDDEGFALLSKTDVRFAKGKDTVSEMELPHIAECNSTDCFLGLGHRRLSILDLSVQGHQPMMKHDRVMVYNGEVYNFIEIREELKDKGYHFTSNCDSEVILSAYDCWGEMCVEKFNGMWAIAIYDMKEETLFLSRDRFGVKPLYFYQDAEKFIFSSEIKQILCDESVPRIVNKEVLAHFLKYNFKEYSEETFFEKIYALKGGCNMRIAFNFDRQTFENIVTWRYYDLKERVAVKPCEDCDKFIGDALRNAIKLRMRSDVKVGSCLSGGLDSSSIVGIVCDELRKQDQDTEKFTTVSIGFPDDEKINETSYSHKVAEFCNCEENLVVPDINSVMSHLDKIVWHQDEPVPHLGFEVSYAVFHGAAEKKCGVFFDGQGGDEGLAGYYPYYANYLWDILKQEGVYAFLINLKKIVNASSMSYRKALLYVLYFNLPFVRDFGTGIRRNKYISKHLKGYINKDNIFMFFQPKDGVGRQIDDFLYGSLPSILHWEDRNSMASSVETRLPFLDYQYVENVLSVDILEKMKNGYTKVPLREYMEGLLPDDVVWRKNKLGFPAPTQRWLREMPTEFVMDLIDNPRSEKLFNVKKIRKHYIQKKGDTDTIGRFIMVELWMRKFDVKCE